MGSPESERQREPDEAAHEVTISPFYVDPYEVTQGDYETLMGENPSYFSGDNLPVENVTWYGAIAYCNALSESRGLTPVYTVEGGDCLLTGYSDAGKSPYSDCLFFLLRQYGTCRRDHPAKDGSGSG